MADQSDRMFLENTQLFSGLSAERIAALESCACVVWFEKGGAITKVDEWGSAAYLVVSGSVMVADASATSGYQEPLGPGTFIGELAMLTEVSYAATVVAAEPVRTLVFTRQAVYRVLESDPDIAEHLSDRLALRLSALAQELRAVDERFEALGASLQRAESAA